MFLIILALSRAETNTLSKGMANAPISKEHFKEGGIAGPFSGELIKLIAIALPKFEQQQLPLEKYNVHVSEDEEYYGVCFSDSALHPLVGGGASKEYPMFQVFINKKTLEVEFCYFSGSGSGRGNYPVVE